MIEIPQIKLPGLTRSEIEKFRDKGFPKGCLYDDPATFMAREDIVGRQAVVVVKIRSLLREVGGALTTETDKWLGAWYVTLYEGLVERDAALAAQGLGYDGEKVRFLGRV